MGEYKRLNVLSQRSFLDDYKDRNAVNEVTAMVNTAGNRRTRRKIEKSLIKTENILRYADKKAAERANEEIIKRTDSNYVHFFAILALTMYEDYRWRENYDNDHGQITSLMERLNKKMVKYEGYSTEEVVKIVDDLTGILLMTDKQAENYHGQS